jgi:hypothetical protein
MLTALNCCCLAEAALVALAFSIAALRLLAFLENTESLLSALGPRGTAPYVLAAVGGPFCAALLGAHHDRTNERQARASVFAYATPGAAQNYVFVMYHCCIISRVHPLTFRQMREARMLSRPGLGVCLGLVLRLRLIEIHHHSPVT